MRRRDNKPRGRSDAKRLLNMIKARPDLAPWLDGLLRILLSGDAEKVQGITVTVLGYHRVLDAGVIQSGPPIGSQGARRRLRVLRGGRRVPEGHSGAARPGVQEGYAGPAR